GATFPHPMAMRASLVSTREAIAWTGASKGFRPRRTSPGKSHKPVSDRGIAWLLDDGTARDAPAAGLGLSGYADIVAVVRGSEEPVQHECTACNAGLPCTGCGAERGSSELQLHDGGKGNQAKQPQRGDATSPEKKAQQHQQACYDKCGGTERGSIECKLGTD